MDDSIADRIELQDQITQLPIKNLLSLNEFLNLEDETIIDIDSDIFATIVEHYSVDKPSEDEESSDEEIKEVDIVEALRAIETVKL